MPIREPDIVEPTLRLLSQAPGRFLTTSRLVQELTQALSPVGHDAAIAPSRKDTYFSQKVRNLVSHRAHNFISKGLATYHRTGRTGGLTITTAGLAHLNSRLPS